MDAVSGESDTTNNCSASVQVTVPEPRHPDVTVRSPSVSDSDPAAGAAFTLSATVRNVGDGDSEATTLRYYRSTDATITTADTEIGTDAVAGLSAAGSAGESVALTAPATPGRYYYGACVDAVSGESDTTNNCSASVQITVQTTVTEPQGDSDLPQGEPDLTVTAQSVSDRDPAAGAEFTLSATVRNAGDAESEATTLRYYRSTDATITTDDTPVGTDAIAGLAAAGSAGESVALKAPATPGPYYYGACVEVVTGESDTTNNCSASVQVTVPEPRHPDLTVTSPSVSDREPAAGAAFTLSATVRNVGDGEAEATTLRYYRSADATITTADTEVGTDAIAGLAAAGSVGESVTLAAPATPGPYYYGACVDAATDESDTTNNCSASVQVTVPEPRHPDLTVTSPSVSERDPAAGAEFTLSATVRNAGDAESEATTLRYYRSTDATITTADTPVSTDAVAKLAASATSDESVELTAPATPGRYYYGACVEAVTGESDTTNNCSASVQVTVPAPKPDLVVGSPTVDESSPATGAAFRLSVTVENDGGGTAASTTLRYYRSSDATITTADTEVGTDSIDGLAATGTSRLSLALTAPATSGTYYYGACVDAVTGESDTANNCSTSVQVTVPAPQPQMPVQAAQPDLLVVWAWPSVSVAYPGVGEQITLSAAVRNAGDAASAATTLRYHRSRSGDETATLVGTDAVAALDASKHSRESVDVTAPSTPGTYLYQACVDAVANESDTTNNCGSRLQVTVLAKPAAKVELTPSSVSFDKISATATLTIRVLDTDGAEMRPNSLGWSSADRTIATVSRGPHGSVSTISVKAIGPGKTTVEVTANDVTGTAMVTVTPTGPRVEVSPRLLDFTALGDSKTVTVRVLDENGDEDADASYSWFGLTYPGRTVILERVTGGLKVTANEGGGGEYDVLSTGATSAALLVRVSQKPASVKVSPSSVRLAPGETQAMSVRVMDANGHDIAVAGSSGRVVYWETSNSAVARVAGERRLPDGYETGATATVTAGTAGTATITARPGGETVEGSATVTVTTQ